jgi:uncharacterized membrane protein YcfT
MYDGAGHPGWNEAPTQRLAVPAAGQRQRDDWADVAKGVCILLVVLWHVIMKHYLQIAWHLPVPLPGAWGAFGDQLLPLRMPVFFTISGMFAANAVLRPWRIAARGRIARFYYLYVLWFAVHTAVLSLVPRFDTLAAHNVVDVIEQLTITPTSLWYLLALGVYFVVARLTRGLPAAFVLVPAFLLSATASAGLLAAPGNRGQLYQNLLFFLAGLRLKPWIGRWVGSVTLRRVLVGGSGYLAVMLAVRQLGAKEWFGVWPVVSVFAVLLGVAGAVEVSRRLRVARPLSRLGRQTLPIYVMHMPLLALLHAALLRPFSSAGTAAQLALAAFLPIGLTALLVVACLALHGWITAAGGGWLFDLPGSRGRATPAPAADEPPTIVLPRIDELPRR